MRSVLFLLTQDLESPSGLGRYWPLARGLASLGYQVSVAALHSNYQALEQKRFVRDGVDIQYVAPMHVMKRGSQKYYFSPAKLLQVSINATIALYRAAVQTPADVIHIGKPHPMNSIAGLLARQTRKKVFVDCDDYEIGVNRFQKTWQKWIIHQFEQFVPRKADLVTTNTYFTRDRLLHTGVAENKVVYLPNGVERDRFPELDRVKAEKIKADYGLQGKKIVVYVGTLGITAHPINLLLEAFQQVTQTVPESRLVLVGGGEDHQTLKDMACQLGIADQVLFVGRVPPDQVSLYYQIANVSVDPVYDDPAARGRSPLKMFESWAAGTPFVTADVGDRKILAGTPAAALLARPGDPQALALAIQSVLTQENVAASLSSTGTKRVEQFYWDRIVAECHSFYQR